VIDPPNNPPPLSSKQRISLVIGQTFIGLFIIFMAGTILHYYVPVSGPYGVHIEGVLLGIFTVLHLRRVLQVWWETSE